MSRGRRIAGVAGRRALTALWAARFGLSSPAHRRRAFARQARLGFEDLGPAFIKMGQLVSVRPDLFSAEMVFEMERLQDSVAPVDFERIRGVLHRSFGRPPEEVFESIDPAPVASASIAQVHKATLRKEYRTVAGEPLASGAEVAVKVVRPGAEAVIESDLTVARRLARRSSSLPPVRRRIDLDGFLGEFERSLYSELDLRNEGHVADRFRFDFRNDPLVVVPRVVWPLTTRSVLTSEYVHGWRLTEVGEAERRGIDALGLALHGAEIFMRQVLVLGRFHADLHPANLFITPDGRICYLDFGIVGRTTPRERIAIAHVLAATVYGDADRAIRYSAELGLEIPPGQLADVRTEVAEIMGRTLGKRPADVRGFAVSFLSMLATRHIRIPIGYGLLIKALVTVEGVARAIYPQIDITESARPFATRLIAAEMARPERLNERLPAALRAALRELAE